MSIFFWVWAVLAMLCAVALISLFIIRPAPGDNALGFVTSFRVKERESGFFLVARVAGVFDYYRTHEGRKPRWSEQLSEARRHPSLDSAMSEFESVSAPMSTVYVRKSETTAHRLGRFLMNL